MYGKPRRSFNIGLICSFILESVTTLAAVFCIRWRRSIWYKGRPKSKLLQLWRRERVNKTFSSCLIQVFSDLSNVAKSISNVGQESMGSWPVRKLNARGSFLRTLTKCRLQKQKTLTLLPMKDLRRIWTKKLVVLNDVIKTSLAPQLCQTLRSLGHTSRLMSLQMKWKRSTRSQSCCVKSDQSLRRTIYFKKPQRSSSIWSVWNQHFWPGISWPFA